MEDKNPIGWIVAIIFIALALALIPIVTAEIRNNHQTLDSDYMYLTLQGGTSGVEDTCYNDGCVINNLRLSYGTFENHSDLNDWIDARFDITYQTDYEIWSLNFFWYNVDTGAYGWFSYHDDQWSAFEGSAACDDFLPYIISIYILMVDDV